MIAHITSDGKEESVIEHTLKTKQLCETKGMRCGISGIMSLCATLHDMGKEKKSFEDYLSSDEITRQKLRGSIAHASTGAKYIYDKYHSTDSNHKILAELISYCIAAHHGLFDCVNEEGKDKFLEKITRVEDYDEACGNAENDFLRDYDLDSCFQKAYQEFHEILMKLQKVPTFGKEISFYLSCLERLMLSILIDSDWDATSSFMNDEKIEMEQIEDRQEIFQKAIQNFDDYIEKLNEHFLEKERTKKEIDIYKARNEMQKECRVFARHPAGIYCLPLPTGGGKTLSGLAYALEYCKEHKQTERIIYISPYISITEQNSDVFRAAIGNEEWILEHHSSVIKNVESNNENYETEQVSQIDINWEEPFICTTFVQFMNTLFSDKKQSIRRMHRLVNSVIVIDEVQSMPIKCIYTFNSMLNFLNIVCNADIILCTATQPKLEIVDHPICYSQPKNMINNVEKRFFDFGRVVVKCEKETYTFEKLKDAIMQQLNRFDSILVVLNTKPSVRKLYDLMEEENIKVVYLTTNLCAEHRSDKINEIKEILNHNQNETEKNRREKIVVISTNLIEAGVDISFECAYRSLTGLDSIAQTAGRCNRNGERKYGEVYIVDIKDEKIGSMNELKESRYAMENLLHGYKEKNSLLTPKWMDQYFENLYDKDDLKAQMNFPIKNMDTNIYDLLSKGFFNSKPVNFINQAYKTAGKEYKVIDNASFGVIVPYKYGAEIIEILEETPNLLEVKKCIRRAQRYTVNVSGNQMKQLEGLLQPVSEYFPGIYIPAMPHIYREEYGITGELETFII